MKKTSTPKRAILLAFAAVALYYYGMQLLWGYSLPLLRGDYAAAIRGSSPSGKIEVLYDGACADYEAGSKAKDAEVAKSKFNNEKRALTLAYQGIVGEDGKVKSGKEQLGADIQFLLGKTLQTLKKDEKAIDAYKQSLRLDPDNRACKYNLEMLQMGGGGGGGADSQDGGGKDSGNPADGQQDQSDPKAGKPKPKI